jgi:transposase
MRQVSLPRNREEIRGIYNQGEEATLIYIETLVSTIKTLEQHVKSLEQHTKSLENRIETLENQVKKNSRNSSKPPSSDGFKKRTKSLRSKSDRPSGGQPGHSGSTLAWSESIDEIIEHSPSLCEGCGSSLVAVDVSDFEQRQVYEIPALRLQITEHQCHEKCCPNCGQLNRGSFPSHVSAPVQYGPRVKGLMVYLMEAQLLPTHRAAELMEDLFECSLSEGSFYTSRHHCYDQLAEVEAQIKAALIQAPVNHNDETGLRVLKQLMWLHVASTGTLSFYFVHPKRGKEAMDEMEILPVFKGTSVHDGLSSYQQYDCEHGLCNAHHLRELTFLVEHYHQHWAEQMSRLLIEIKTAVEQAQAKGHQALSKTQLIRFDKRYQALINKGLQRNPRLERDPDSPKQKGKVKQTPARNLLERLNQHKESVLAFMKDFRVPFDNNQAERDLRMMKLKLKISGCFRSLQGAKEFCRIRGYLSTLRKQGIKLLDALTAVFVGQPILPSFSAE